MKKGDVIELRTIDRYWLWVWVKGGKVKSGWDFDTREDAESFFHRHFREEPVKHEITYEPALC